MNGSFMVKVLTFVRKRPMRFRYVNDISEPIVMQRRAAWRHDDRFSSDLLRPASTTGNGHVDREELADRVGRRPVVRADRSRKVFHQRASHTQFGQPGGDYGRDLATGHVGRTAFVQAMSDPVDRSGGCNLSVHVHYSATSTRWMGLIAGGCHGTSRWARNRDARHQRRGELQCAVPARLPRARRCSPRRSASSPSIALRQAGQWLAAGRRDLRCARRDHHHRVQRAPEHPSRHR